MWDWIESLLLALGINKGAAVTGLVGTFLSFRFVVQLGTFGRVTAFVGGWFSAGILSPLLVDWFGLKPTYIGGVGFLIGALSMTIMAAALMTIKNADIIGVFTKRPSARKDPNPPGEGT